MERARGGEGMVTEEATSWSVRAVEASMGTVDDAIMFVGCRNRGGRAGGGRNEGPECMQGGGPRGGWEGVDGGANT